MFFFFCVCPVFIILWAQRLADPNALTSARIKRNYRMATSLLRNQSWKKKKHTHTSRFPINSSPLTIPRNTIEKKRHNRLRGKKIQTKENTVFLRALVSSDYRGGNSTAGRRRCLVTGNGMTQQLFGVCITASFKLQQKAFKGGLFLHIFSSFLQYCNVLSSYFLVTFIGLTLSRLSADLLMRCWFFCFVIDDVGNSWENIVQNRIPFLLTSLLLYHRCYQHFLSSW